MNRHHNRRRNNSRADRVEKTVDAVVENDETVEKVFQKDVEKLSNVKNSIDEQYELLSRDELFDEDDHEFLSSINISSKVLESAPDFLSPDFSETVENSENVDEMVEDFENVAEMVEDAESVEIQGSEYLDDDLPYLDEVVEEYSEIGIFKQADNVVSWEVANFYNEKGHRRNRFLMRSDPPVFTISSSDGAAAEFLVTKELSRSLAKVFYEIQLAYYGAESKGSRKQYLDDVENFPKRVVEWIVKNKVKFFVFLALVVTLVLLIIL